jgi:hypothetical protein
VAVAFSSFAAPGGKVTLWKDGDGGIRKYRIPALATAPNGDLVAACDARTNHGGDLCFHQPINISVRRSTDGGKTWSAPKNSWTWPWEQGGVRWSGSDPSFVVDAQAKKIFLFYNVWEWQQVEANARAAGDANLQNRAHGVYRFFVQESSDNGATWSKPREISKDIAVAGWPCGAEEGKGGFIFISSGSGIQTKDGTLLHTTTIDTTRSSVHLDARNCTGLLTIPIRMSSLLRKPYPEKNTNFHRTPLTKGGSAHGSMASASSTPAQKTLAWRYTDIRYPMMLVSTTTITSMKMVFCILYLNDSDVRTVI